MKMHRALVTAAAVVGLTVAAPIAPASATPSTGEVDTLACGFYRAPGPAGALEARYKHCTSERYAVKVTIDYHVGPDGETCVQPNEDKFLGYTNYVYNAYYNGKLC